MANNYTLRGWGWGHTLWMGTALYALLAIGTAQTRWGLNHGHAIDAFKSGKWGFERAQQLTRDGVDGFDNYTLSRWGDVEGNSTERYQLALTDSCVGTINPNGVITESEILAYHTEGGLPARAAFCEFTGGLRWGTSDPNEVFEVLNLGLPDGKDKIVSYGLRSIYSPIPTLPDKYYKHLGQGEENGNEGTDSTEQATTAKQSGAVQ